MNMPRTRGHIPARSFSDAAKQARAGSGNNRFKRPDGLFDRLVLGERPIWLRFSPDQLYAQMLYDRATKKVIETGRPDENGDVMYPARPWLEYTTHFVPARKRSFTCSGCADRSQPCRGCGIRAFIYDSIRDREVATGVKDEEARKNVPVQASTRYAMGATVLEKILEMPLMDKNNRPRKSKEGRDLMKTVPAPLSGYSPQQIQTLPGAFGKNFHMNFGPVHLGNLGSIDCDLWNYCASCAESLIATDFHCPECDTLVYQDNNGVQGPDLRSMRETSMPCKKCRYEGFLNPVLRCTSCDDPQQGSLLAFDLRLRLEKDPADSKKSTIQLVGHRMPDYASLFDAETANHVYEMVYHPLDIAAIYAPESLDAQAWALPEDLKEYDASYHLKKKVASPYGNDRVEEEVVHEDGDPDQMTFDD